jgi:hypothetical protein
MWLNSHGSSSLSKRRLRSVLGAEVAVPAETGSRLRRREPTGRCALEFLMPRPRRGRNVLAISKRIEGPWLQPTETHSSAHTARTGTRAPCRRAQIAPTPWRRGTEQIAWRARTASRNSYHMLVRSQAARPDSELAGRRPGRRLRSYRSLSAISWRRNGFHCWG